MIRFRNANQVAEPEQEARSAMSPLELVSHPVQPISADDDGRPGPPDDRLDESGKAGQTATDDGWSHQQWNGPQEQHPQGHVGGQFSAGHQYDADVAPAQVLPGQCCGVTGGPGVELFEAAPRESALGVVERNGPALGTLFQPLIQS